MLIKECIPGKIYNIEAHKGSGLVNYNFKVEYHKENRLYGHDIPEMVYGGWTLQHNAYNNHYDIKEITKEINPEYFL